jgi:hypothetical protein
MNNQCSQSGAGVAVTPSFVLSAAFAAVLTGHALFR